MARERQPYPDKYRPNQDNLEKKWVENNKPIVNLADGRTKAVMFSESGALWQKLLPNGYWHPCTCLGRGTYLNEEFTAPRHMWTKAEWK